MERKAVVMGASSGLGREVALALLKKGWRVGVAARRREPLEELKKDFPLQVEVAEIDVVENCASTELLALVKRLGGMDLYFHSSGVGKQNPMLEEDVELSTVETNAMGFTRMVGAAFRYMAAHGGGQIAVISSIAGTRGLGPAPSYSATKALQAHYIEALEQLSQNRQLGITFTDIRPGFVDTMLLKDTHYPMLMRPDRVARAIVKAIERHRHVVIIDWRYWLLVMFWRLVPRWLWRHFPLVR